MHKESCIKIKTRKNKLRLRKELNILISMHSFYKWYILFNLYFGTWLYITLGHSVRTVNPSSCHLWNVDTVAVDNSYGKTFWSTY